MTTIALADWVQSPEIFIGASEQKRLTTAALTDVTHHADEVDFLLYELDRATVVEDAALPLDVVRLNSIVRYRAKNGNERTVKLVLPDDHRRDASFRLAATSMHGAALIGLRPGQVLSWIGPDGSADQVEVVQVANAPGQIGERRPVTC
jgi:regulator of nucleoside diphosphate kinase